MSTFTQDLNNGDSAYFTGGNFFQILSSSNLGVDVEFFKNNSPVSKHLEVADAFEADFNDPNKARTDLGFHQVKVTNNSGTNITGLKIEVTQDNAKTNSVGGSITANETIPTTLTTIADTTLSAATKTSIAASNSSRKEIIVQNLSTSPASIRVGDTNTGASRGIEVGIGGSVSLKTTAQVYAYSTGAAVLQVLEIE